MFKANYLFFGLGLLLMAGVLAPQVPALQGESGASSRRSGARSSGANPAPTSRRPPVTASMTADEARFLELLNHERSERGLVELKPDSLLVEVAREHSREMCDKNYFDHVSPTVGSRTPMDRYLHAMRHRPAHACVGENLFYCSLVDVERGHHAFMNSPGHRANILYAPFRRGGIGIYKSDSGEFWVTEMFLTTES
jgi:uncharacterized protein YkwD